MSQRDKKSRARLTCARFWEEPSCAPMQLLQTPKDRAGFLILVLGAAILLALVAYWWFKALRSFRLTTSAQAAVVTKAEATG